MQGEKVNTSDLATVLAGPGRLPGQAKGRLHRWAAAGIIPPLGKAGAGSRSPWQYDAQVAQIAAVLFAAHDQAGIQDHDRLKGLYRLLADGEPALIEEIVADVTAGREPVLVVTLWGKLGGSAITSFAVRLEDERDRPIVAPTDDHERITDAVLWLAPILARFLTDNIVPLRKGGE